MVLFRTFDVRLVKIAEHFLVLDSHASRFPSTPVYMCTVYIVLRCLSQWKDGQRHLWMFSDLKQLDELKVF